MKIAEYGRKQIPVSGQLRILDPPVRAKDLSGIRLVQAADQLGQSSLATAVTAGQKQDFILLDRQIEGSQVRGFTLAAAIGKFDIGQPYAAGVERRQIPVRRTVLGILLCLSEFALQMFYFAGR